MKRRYACIFQQLLKVNSRRVGGSLEKGVDSAHSAMMVAVERIRASMSQRRGSVSDFRRLWLPTFSRFEDRLAADQLLRMFENL